MEPGNLHFYVATNGGDRWSGRLPEPNPDNTDGPFASLERARDAVRERRPASGREEPVTVMIRGGVYPRTEPFILRPEDSGGPDAPVTYAAYPGERPVITGGRAITGWRKGDGGIWTADLPDAKAGGWQFHQLFVNGSRRRRPRCPSGDMLRMAGDAVDTSSWAAQCPDTDELPKRSFQFRPGDIRPDWRNIDDVEIVVLQYWMAPRLRIRSIDEENNTVLFTGGSWRPLTWSLGYYADNVFEELKQQPGAWYLDRRAGVLHYHPLGGEDVAGAEFIAPVAEQLVRFEGDSGERSFVHDVAFRGLALEHTRWTLPPEGYHCVQAEIAPPAAVEMLGALRCRIEDCELSHLGGWGIEAGRGCKDVGIVGGTVRDVGAGCVKVGDSPSRLNCRDDADAVTRTLISDNRLLDGGHIALGPAAVWIGHSGGNVVSHNEISGQFTWAVSVGWRWGYFPLGRARDNIVEHNHVHHLGTGVLGVHGALYALGAQPGTVFRNNYIHDIYCNGGWAAGEGIILDNGCAGILVENNVVHDAAAGGWGCNFNCFGNVICNNIFAYGTKFQLMRYGDPPSGTPPPNGEVFTRNIVVWRDGPLLHDKDWLSFQTLWDHNLYWRDGGEPVTFMKYTFDEWQAKGMDTHSVIADPLFVDSANGDYSLRPDSPAFEVGFRPIDLSTVGPRDKP